MLRRLVLVCWTPLLFAQGEEIRAMLAKSEAMWNRGDLVAFVSDYEDAPETLSSAARLFEAEPKRFWNVIAAATRIAMQWGR